MEESFHYTGTVLPDWVDYNGHMNDAEYNKAFSHATDVFIDFIGLDEQSRQLHHYTVFTLETHICYLQEMHEGAAFTVHARVLDYDAKRMHVFLTMVNEAGELVATLEEMLMGIDQQEGRGAPFPEAVAGKIGELYEICKEEEQPQQAGRTIGIRRKK